MSGWKFVYVRPSERKGKKFTALFVSADGKRTKRVSFGAAGMNDFILWNKKEGSAVAKQRRRNYINRHRKRENWNDPFTAGWWARWFLWEKPTLAQSRDFVKRKLRQENGIHTAMGALIPG